MSNIEALRLALEALEDACGNRCNAEYNPCFQRNAITAIKAALVNEALERKAENARQLGLDYEPLEAKDEPWEKFCDSNCVWTDHHPDCKLAQRTWVGLTDEEMKTVVEQELVNYWDGEYIDTTGARDCLTNFARAIEAAHGIKGEA